MAKNLGVSIGAISKIVGDAQERGLTLVTRAQLLAATGCADEAREALRSARERTAAIQSAAERETIVAALEGVLAGLP